MDGTYYVGRGELLQWINSTVGMHLNKIEQTASGAVACQLLDALHPGSINLAKVNFNAKNEYEFIANYKILQASFLKLHIDKEVEVSKLVKARPLDNMEFMQWFKSYWDAHNGGQIHDYNGPSRRNASKTGDVKVLKPSNTVKRSSSSTVSTGMTMSGTPRAKGAPTRTLSSSKSLGGSGGLGATHSSAASEDTSHAVQDLTEQVTELKLRVDGVERERDFYFDKLRDIEILCQLPQLQTIPIVKIFEKILYAADEAEAKQAMTEAQDTYMNGI